MDLPVGLDHRRHIVQPQHSPWPRRIVLTLLAAMLGLALANTFGQQPGITTASSPAATLTLDSPERLRGGLVFTSHITIVAHSDVHDAQIFLSSGWWLGMTLNAVAPQANNETSDARGVTFDYGEISPGETLQIFISWQTNPTTVGTRDQDVVLSDGSTPLVAIHRSYTIFF
jgi:hypothetical protein